MISWLRDNWLVVVVWMFVVALIGLFVYVMIHSSDEPTPDQIFQQRCEAHHGHVIDQYRSQLCIDVVDGHTIDGRRDD